MNSVSEPPMSKLLAVGPETAENKSVPAELSRTTTELRLQRIDELQVEALAKPDALEANLGVANGELLRIGLRIGEKIEAALGSEAGPVERLDRLLPVFDMYLKVMRQVDRFSQLDRRLAAGRQTGTFPLSH